MSKETKIEWADSTVNFWSGCTKVSDGCKNCYAEALSNRKLGNIGGWGNGAPRKRHQSAFDLAFQLNKKPWVCDACGHEHLTEVAKDASEIIECRGCLAPVSIHRRRVFSLSLGDWLDPEVPIEWLAEMLDVIRRCDQLQWLLVTKRPELFFERIFAAMLHAEKADPNDEKPYRPGTFCRWLEDWKTGSEPKHVMVLTSVENQKAADERIPKLLEIPGRHGLSCEPLLGPVNLVSKSTQRGAHFKTITGTGWMEDIQWVIVGGESGPTARACNVEWIRSIGNQCDAAGVPVYVKQLGAKPVMKVGYSEFPRPYVTEDVGEPIKDKKGGDWFEWPGDLRVREFPEV